MDSVVLNPDVAEALEDVEAALRRLGDVGVVPAGHRDAVLLIRRVEHVGHRVDSLRNRLFTAIDDDMLYAPDRHFSAKIMVRHVGRLSPGEAAGRASAARALAEMPELKAAYERGEVGTCQVRRLGRAFANKRVREQLIADEKRFIDLAKNKSYKAFDDRVTDWVRLVDQDGTADTTQAQHDNRDFGLGQEYDLGWNLKGRWDAFLEMTLRAATGDGQGNRPGFVTNIVIDQTTFEAELAKIFGGTPEAPDPWDPDFACRTLNGNPIHSTEAMAAAMVDKVRRLVIDAAGVTIDMGRGPGCSPGTAVSRYKPPKHIAAGSAVTPGAQTARSITPSHGPNNKTEPAEGAPAPPTVQRSADVTTGSKSRATPWAEMNKANGTPTNPTAPKSTPDNRRCPLNARLDPWSPRNAPTRHSVTINIAGFVEAVP